MRWKPLSESRRADGQGVMDQQFDIVIAGGGMVGASLACALAGLPLRLAVVERVPFDDAAQPSFDLRTTALSRTSQRILDALGIWSAVADSASNSTDAKGVMNPLPFMPVTQ